MITKKSLYLVLAFLTICGCAGIRETEQAKPNLFEIEGILQFVQGSSATVLIQYPQQPKGSAVGDIAQDVVRKCLLIEGMKTTGKRVSDNLCK